MYLKCHLSLLSYIVTSMVNNITLKKSWFYVIMFQTSLCNVWQLSSLLASVYNYAYKNFGQHVRYLNFIRLFYTHHSQTIDKPMADNKPPSLKINICMPIQSSTCLYILDAADAAFHETQWLQSKQAQHHIQV